MRVHTFGGDLLKVEFGVHSLFTSSNGKRDVTVDIKILKQHRKVEKWGGAANEPLVFNTAVGMRIESAYLPQVKIRKEPCEPDVFYVCGFTENTKCITWFKNEAEAEKYMFIFEEAINEFNRRGGFQ